MNETLRQIGERLVGVRDFAVDYWSAALAQGGTPLLSLAAWLLAPVGLIVLFSIARRRPPIREVAPVQLLVSRGAMVPEFPDGAKRSPVAPRPATALLHLTLGNLNRYPVQWLEVAVRRSGRAAPKVVRIDAIVPPLSAVDASVRLPNEVEGDLILDVVVYASSARRKLHRHRVTLEWDAWGRRWTASTRDQRCVSVGRLASDERGAAILDVVDDVASPVGATTPQEAASLRPVEASGAVAAAVPSVAAPPTTAWSAPPAAPIAPASAEASASTQAGRADAAPVGAARIGTAHALPPRVLPVPAAELQASGAVTPPPTRTASLEPAAPSVLDFVPPPVRDRRTPPPVAAVRAGPYQGPTEPVGWVVGAPHEAPAIHDLDDIWLPLPEPTRARPRWRIAPTPVAAVPAFPLERAPARADAGPPAAAPVSFVPPPSATPRPTASYVAAPSAPRRTDAPPTPTAVAAVPASVPSDAPPTPTAVATVPAPVPSDAPPTPSPSVAVGLADLWSRLPRRPTPTPATPTPARPDAAARVERSRLGFPDDF